MFWFIHDEQARAGRSDAPVIYFDSGKEVAVFLRGLLEERCVVSALATRDEPSSPLSVLEFASGYGRATRHFANVLPGIDFVACDIH